MKLIIVAVLLLFSTADGGISETWMRQGALRKKAAEAKREPIPLYTLNLDLPPKDR